MSISLITNIAFLLCSLSPQVLIAKTIVDAPFNTTELLVKRQSPLNPSHDREPAFPFHPAVGVGNRPGQARGSRTGVARRPPQSKGEVRSDCYPHGKDAMHIAPQNMQLCSQLVDEIFDYYDGPELYKKRAWVSGAKGPFTDGEFALPIAWHKVDGANSCRITVSRARQPQASRFSKPLPVEPAFMIYPIAQMLMDAYHVVYHCGPPEFEVPRAGYILVGPGHTIHSHQEREFVIVLDALSLDEIAHVQAQSNPYSKFQS